MYFANMLFSIISAIIYAFPFIDAITLTLFYAWHICSCETPLREGTEVQNIGVFESLADFSHNSLCCINDYLKIYITVKLYISNVIMQKIKLVLE